MTTPLLPATFTSAVRPPLERIEVEPDPEGSPCPEVFRDQLMIDVIHDGNNLPPHFMCNEAGVTFPMDAAFLKGCVIERDWGAEVMAHCLTSALHLDAYHRVTVARSLIDFGRFPGETLSGSNYMQRMAINAPFSGWLSFQQKKSLLEEQYDEISNGMDRLIKRQRLKICMHTYDETNHNDSRRPPVSLVTRSRGVHRNFDIPAGIFDPMFPPELAEDTCDRLLRSRMALTLEEDAIHVTDNFPYPLPEGSVEVRAQVYFFFAQVQEAYDLAYPTTDEDDTPGSPRCLVWNMLLDTNLRSATSESLRSYLHMFRHPPRGEAGRFYAARLEYERVNTFVQTHYDTLVRRYRDAVERPSSLAIEVRKDVVWDFDTMKPKWAEARIISRSIASAVQTYLEHDLPAKLLAQQQSARRFS